MVIPQETETELKYLKDRVIELLHMYSQQARDRAGQPVKKRT